MRPFAPKRELLPSRTIDIRPLTIVPWGYLAVRFPMLTLGFFLPRSSFRVRLHCPRAFSRQLQLFVSPCPLFSIWNSPPLALVLLLSLNPFDRKRRNVPSSSSGFGPLFLISTALRSLSFLCPLKVAVDLSLLLPFHPFFLLLAWRSPTAPRAISFTYSSGVHIFPTDTRSDVPACLPGRRSLLLFPSFSRTFPILTK